MVDEIYDIWEVSWWQTPWVLLLIAVFGTAILVLFMLRYRHYKIISISQEERAYRQLQALLARKEVPQKEVYHLITRNIKYRLTARYQDDIDSCTDEELCDYIEQRHASLSLAHELIATIRRGSLVKFASENVSAEDCARDGALIHCLRQDPLDTSGRLRDTNNT